MRGTPFPLKIQARERLRPAGSLLTICFHTGQLTAQAIPSMHVLSAWLSTFTFTS